MQADMYYNRLLKPEKQFFSCRTVYINIVYLLISCFKVNPLLYFFLNIKGTNRLGGRND